PERAVREFIRALAMHDAQTFASVVVPNPRATRFLNTQPLSPDDRANAERRLETLQLHLSNDPFLLRGEPVSADANGDYPVGSVGHIIAAGQGGPSVVTLLRPE